MAVDTINSLMVNFLVYSRRVLEVFQAAIDEAKTEQTDKIAVATLPIMGAFPELNVIRQGAILSPVFYVNDPQRNVEMLSIGAEVMREFHGSDAIAQARTTFQEDLLSQAGDKLASPLFYGGFAFAPGSVRAGVWKGWPDGIWVWPRWQWVKEGGRVSLVVSHRITPDDNAEDLFRDLQTDLQRMAEVNEVQVVSTRSPIVVEGDSSQADSWKAAVAQTVQGIRMGKLEKVVLARKIALQADNSFDGVVALQHLKATNPTSVCFYLHDGNDVFLGATPERLVETQKSQVSIDCLAGTAPRGLTPAEDEELGRELLHSAKDLNEHQLVRTGILASVQNAAKVSAPLTPSLRKFTHVQHLFTPIRGDLIAGKSLFDLVEQLHPTPAVAGLPKDLASQSILQREQMDRGYYAGPIGWMDREGNGTFVVALRSGLLTGEKAELYAGAGIVSDSDAEAEWTETEWKFTPMKVALGVDLK